MDMAIAYWRDRITDFTEIYQMVDDIGALLTEYAGDLATEPQDYFAARSILAAEWIMDSASRDALREMLLTFHQNVSPYRICHYHVFRRHAYDSRLIGRAFATWQEGKDFYDNIYEKVRSPYVRQHQALFLKDRGSYAEAFKAIDLARAQAGDSNFTIRNSHAIILFRANIDFASDPVARGTLDRSMEILMDCYRSDRRKGFHAMTFAHHAVQYWGAYGDAKARQYLLHASKWLEEQRQEEPWLNDIGRLQRLVRTRLA